MKVIEAGDSITYSTDTGEIGLAESENMWYILFEGFISKTKCKITSITFTRRDEYEEDD